MAWASWARRGEQPSGQLTLHSPSSDTCRRWVFQFQEKEAEIFTYIILAIKTNLLEKLRRLILCINSLKSAYESPQFPLANV